jgi:hypothetical protein
MPKFRSIPKEIEAFLYLGPSPEFGAWMEEQGETGSGNIQPSDTWGKDEALWLWTLQGQRVRCLPGEWIIVERTGGRYYPCAATAFLESYEAVQ